MAEIEPEIIGCLDRVIEYLWTKENRDSFLKCNDADQLVNHIMPSVMILDRWLARRKHEQQSMHRQRKTIIRFGPLRRAFLSLHQSTRTVPRLPDAIHL